RQRLELRRKLSWPLGEGAAGLEVREDAAQLLDLAAEPRIARLRLLLDPLEAPLDVVAIGDEQLEPKRLEVVGRHPRPREPVEHDEERVDLAEVAEQLGPGPLDVDDADRRGRHLLRLDDTGESVEALVRDRRHADPGRGGRVRERLEQRRLAGAREPDDPDLERHLLARDLLLERDERSVLERLDRALGLTEDRR